LLQPKDRLQRHQLWLSPLLSQLLPSLSQLLLKHSPKLKLCLKRKHQKALSDLLFLTLRFLRRIVKLSGVWSITQLPFIRISDHKLDKWTLNLHLSSKSRRTCTFQTLKTSRKMPVVLLNSWNKSRLLVVILVRGTKQMLLQMLTKLATPEDTLILRIRMQRSTTNLLVKLRADLILVQESFLSTKP
jgi:hypothetical protein